MKKQSLPITTHFAHTLITEVTTMAKTISSNENLGKNVRTFLKNYPYEEFSAWWWYDIYPKPPELEEKLISKTIFYASRTRLNDEEVGKRIRTFTTTYLKKPGHTLVWSELYASKK